MSAQWSMCSASVERSFDRLGCGAMRRRCPRFDASTDHDSVISNLLRPDADCLAHGGRKG